MVDNFDFGSQAVKNALTGKLKILSTYNGLPVQNTFVFEAMDRLRNRFLNTALSDVPKAVLRAEAQKITEMQKAAANNAPLVDVEKELANTPIEALGLSASTWNALSRSGIKTVGDVFNLLDIDRSALASIRNFEKSSLDQLRQKMQDKGYLNDG